MEKKINLPRITLLLLVILLGIFLTLYFSIPREGPFTKDTDIARSAESIRNSLELYRADKGRYPESIHDLIPEYLERIENFGLEKVIYS